MYHSSDGGPSLTRAKVQHDAKTRPRWGLDPSHRHEEGILKDGVDLAERYDTVVHTAVRADMDADAAILREAARGRFDLVIMGVNRRPGETLFFGKVPEAILAKTTTSVLFISG
jgi:nucleotide-binding universal stress UspA family protein